MKFPSVSPSLIQTATAITFGVIPWQNSVEAVVDFNISEEESNSSRPQLLVQDSQQVAVLTDSNSDANDFLGADRAKKYTFAGDKRLNKLANLAHQSPATLISSDYSTSSEPVVIDVSPSSGINNSTVPEPIYIPVQSSRIDDSDSVVIPVESQEQTNLSIQMVNSDGISQSSTISNDYSVSINVIPAETGNSNSDENKPVLISPVTNTTDNNFDQQVAILTNESARENPVALSSQVEFPENPVNQETNDRQLVSRVPVEVNYYNPAVIPPVGSMVSPDLPYLYPPDEYLPDGDKNRLSEGFIWPAQGVLTSGYGWRWGRMHKGIDIAAPVGTPIVAVADGKVITAGWNSGGYGNLVKLKHYDGSITLYAHNSRIFVRRGQEVKQGQHIANMGSTGFSTGPHLHFELHPRGQSAVNPIAFLPKK